MSDETISHDNEILTFVVRLISSIIMQTVLVCTMTHLNWNSRVEGHQLQRLQLDANMVDHVTPRRKINIGICQVDLINQPNTRSISIVHDCTVKIRTAYR